MTKGIDYRYRIKTQTEFNQEFGGNWKQLITYSWLSPSMDYLFGRPLTSKEYQDIKADRRGIDTWSISVDMLIKNNQ